MPFASDPERMGSWVAMLIMNKAEDEPLYERQNASAASTARLIHSPQINPQMNALWLCREAPQQLLTSIPMYRCSLCGFPSKDPWLPFHWSSLL